MEVNRTKIVAGKCSLPFVRHCRCGGYVRWMILLCFVIIFHIIPGVAEQDIADTSASLQMNSGVVWQGDHSLMRCIATPKNTSIRKVLWMRREGDDTMRNVYLYSRDHPMATGPYVQFSGRTSGWLNVGEGTHYLSMNSTLVSDAAEYYCTITDGNYADKISPAKQLTVNVKHFNHSIRVNGSSAGFSNCEELTLNGSGDVNELTLTCSVSSWPVSQLSWTSSPSNQQEEMFSKTQQNYSVDNSNMYTCTSTTTLMLHALISKRTDLNCRADYDTLRHTSVACVTVIYENFSPPSAMTSGSVQLTVVLWTCGAIAIVILLVSVFAALVHIRRRPGRHGNKSMQSSQNPSFMKVPADEI